MRPAAALSASTAALAAFAVVAGTPTAHGATRTISMNGAPVAKALVADLAYFYRHQLRHPPRFSLPALRRARARQHIAQMVASIRKTRQEIGQQPTIMWADPPQCDECLRVRVRARLRVPGALMH